MYKVIYLCEAITFVLYIIFKFCFFCWIGLLMTFPTHPQTYKTHMYAPVYRHIDTDAGARRAYTYTPERGVVSGRKIYIYIFPPDTFRAVARRINLYDLYGFKSFFLTCDQSEKKRI